MEILNCLAIYTLAQQRKTTTRNKKDCFFYRNIYMFICVYYFIFYIALYIYILTVGTESRPK